MKKLLTDFRAFISRGNVLDLAVGVMIGAAFSKIVSSLVSDICMPLLGLVTGGLDFSGLFLALNGKTYPDLQSAVADNAATLNYGAFLSNILDFFLIALCVFIFVRIVSKVMPQKAEEPKKQARLCVYCKGEVHDKATRCPHCTSILSQDETETNGKSGKDDSANEAHASGGASA